MAFVSEVKYWVSDQLNREPRGHWGYWLAVAYGIVAVVAALGSLVVIEIDVGLEFILLGFAVGTMGAAELVPTDRVPLARNLRIISYCCFILYPVLLFGPWLLTASHETQLLAMAAVPFLLLYAWLMYRALNA